MTHLPKSGRGGARPGTGGARPGAGRPKGSRNRTTVAGLEAAKPLGERALKVLEELMDNPDTPPQTRAVAASYVLDRVYGRPRQALDVTEHKPEYVSYERPLTPAEWAAEFGDDATKHTEH